ncbi:MAG: nitroreductase family protein, partial [Pseudomonadota bacterium]
MLKEMDRQHFENARGVDITRSLLSIFRRRKTTRFFKKSHVDEEIVKNAIAIAWTAPSGANKQPWSFALISDEHTKEEIRERAEQEEREFYQEKAPKQWLNDLKPFHTNADKSFISQASYLIPVFCKNYDLDEENQKTNNYYVKESTGLATGLLIGALHMAGLSVLTYTPSNRNSTLRDQSFTCKGYPPY